MYTLTYNTVCICPPFPPPLRAPLLLHRVDAVKKRRQMVLLFESVDDVKTHFNRRLLDLRELKKQISGSLEGDSMRIQDISNELTDIQEKHPACASRIAELVRSKPFLPGQQAGAAAGGESKKAGGGGGGKPLFVARASTSAEWPELRSEFTEMEVLQVREGERDSSFQARTPQMVCRGSFRGISFGVYLWGISLGYIFEGSTLMSALPYVHSRENKYVSCVPRVPRVSTTAETLRP